MSGFFTAPQVGWGPTALEQLSGLGAHRPFLVVDPAVHRSHGERRVVEELEKADATMEVFSDVTIEPTVASIAAGTERARSFRPDWIVAVGGGSTIDTAKAVWIGYARPDVPIETVTPLVDLNLRAHAHLVALPTTTGSGSEATWTAHLRTDDGRLLEVGSRELMPDWALLDVGLVLSLPPRLTAETAADAIAHAIESLLSEWANAFSNALAREALAAALPNLVGAVRHPDDTELRARLQAAAALAGLASANAQVGIAHAVAHALGGYVPIPHARLVTALLPYAVEFNYPVAREKVMALGSVVGPAHVQNRSALTDRLRALWQQVGLPNTLAGAGVGADRLAEVREGVIERARASPSAVANPRVPSAEELGRFLDAAMAGLAVGF